MEVAQLHASELRRSLEGVSALNEQERMAIESERTNSSRQTVRHKQQIRKNHARETERMIEDIQRGYD